ncbi:L,D-transpeptidase family protein [Flavobacterium sp. DGU11]|uniref:L,D-transpeptidase family protein n=1 Tax=Flavobacterium arundinis TaxID=3139143 RepID=A0ABU9HYY9_9FLAO
MKRNKMLWIFFIIPVVIAIYYLYPGQQLPSGKTIDRLVVHKAARKMEAWSGNELLKTYSVSLGKDPIGHKQFEGDCKTPEGSYTINARNPNSAYYKNLGISYPNAADKATAAKQGKSPGGDVKIHGLRNGRGYIGKFHRWKDWTAGCIAVTNEEMEELYKAVKEDAVIEILP